MLMDYFNRSANQTDHLLVNQLGFCAQGQFGMLMDCFNRSANHQAPVWDTKGLFKLASHQASQPNHPPVNQLGFCSQGQFGTLLDYFN